MNLDNLINVVCHLQIRHQKRVDLQREDGGRVLNGRNAFPRSDTHNGFDHPMELSRSKG